MENSTKMDDLEGTTIFGNIHIYWLVDGWNTHLKNMRKSNGIISPGIGVKI